ncbi:hypothetical protein D3C86_2121280 [compost metagenome]
MRSVTRSVRGSVPIEERLTKASCTAGQTPEKYCLIDRPCVRTRIGYTTNSTSARPM